VDDTGRVAPRVPSAEELELIRESLRTGRSFSWSGDEPPTPERVVWGRKRFSWVTYPKAPALNSTLMAHVAIARQRPRERRERRTSRTVGSRGDPSPEPDLASTRPPLTQPQRAWLKREVDRRRRAVIDAGLNVTRAEYDLFRQDRA
jgi:hypothetical protein